MEKRKHTLKAHIAALQLIRTEIFYRNTPLEDIFLRLEETCGSHAAGFYQKVFDIAAKGLAFSTAANQCYDLLFKDGLLKEDISMIKNACSVLGRYDGSVQAEQLSAAIRQLEDHLSVLQNELNSKGRLYKTAGATAGIILALIVL